jgi:nicotinamide-nucleotide amidase
VKGRCTFYFLPGVPREFKALCRQDIIPELLERDPQQEHFDYRIMKLVAVPESHLARGAGPIMRAFPEVRFGYRAHYPEVWFKFRTTASTQDEASACADEIEAAIRDEFGSKVFGMADDTLQGAVGSLLKSGGLKLSTAESCTGGMVGDLLTSVPGSSDYYLGGAVTYSNEMKKAVLGVPEETLSVYGAVSEECARAMATGARQRFGADLAVAVTGIAGPGGGTPDKPVGTVHLALATPTGIVHKRREFRPGRDMVRTAAASTALNLIRLYLLGVT